MNKGLSRIRQDVLAVGLVGFGVFLAIALATYNPADPSLNSIGKSVKVLNACGWVGSFLSDLLFQLFGVMAWAAPISLMISGLSVITRSPSAPVTWRGTGWVLSFATTGSALFSLYLTTWKSFPGPTGPGGLLGSSLGFVLTQFLNSIGAQVVLWSVLVSLLLLSSDRGLLYVGRAFASWIRHGAGGAVRRMKGATLQIFGATAGWFRRTQVFSVALTRKNNEANPVAVQLNSEGDLRGAEPQGAVPENKFPTRSLDPRANNRQSEKASWSADRSSLRIELSVVEKSKAKFGTSNVAGTRVENWSLPKLSMLESPPSTRARVDEKEIRRKAEILTEKLGKFGVTGEVVAAHSGPMVTLFEFRPAADVKLSKITELEDDLSLALSSESLRIIAPIPGRDVVGIETSNSQRETVFLRDLLEEEEFWSSEVKLPVAIGKSTMGENQIVDLRRMPHLLVAGTTGSGKSVFTVSLIAGLLFRHSPKTLRMIIVDPKQVDYTQFEKIPHLLLPIVTDSRQGAPALRWAVQEMEKRYRSMGKFGARGLEAFNEAVAKLTSDEQKIHEQKNAELEESPQGRRELYYFEPQPYIVIVIEEFGDLMAVDSGTVESLVQRLTQMARACGIHLVLAMQRPSREILPGVIKTNVPGRVSFKVASAMESKIILDETGAERLLTQGDMLIRSPGAPNVTRYHGPFLKDAEVIKIAQFWAEQGTPQFSTSAMEALNSDGAVESSNGAGTSEFDELYDQILAWAATQKSVSASLIQRRFSIGYPRAARIIETFEREGVVGPPSGSKARQVMVSQL